MSVCLSACLFVCRQDISQSIGLIFMMQKGWPWTIELVDIEKRMRARLRHRGPFLQTFSPYKSAILDLSILFKTNYLVSFQ